MHTLDLLEVAIETAGRGGFTVRREWLGGNGGGACEFGGRKWIFVDLALDTVEQLEQVLDALRNDPAVARLPLAPVLTRLLYGTGSRRAA